MATEVRWDDAALREELAAVSRDVLVKYAGHVADEARLTAPVLKAPLRDHAPPGTLKESIHVQDPYEDSRGVVVNVRASFVTFFLEKPARQLHRPRRFLTDALYGAGGRL